MPATFDSIGLRFLYPENWVEVVRDREQGGAGVTLELPCGGFFSIERIDDERPDDVLIEELVRSIEQGYQDAEHEQIHFDKELVLREGKAGETAMEIRFYYLDLLIVSHLMLLKIGDARYAIQTQAESRDFDQNLPVFNALLKQICE